MDALAEHERKRDGLVRNLRAVTRSGAAVGLRKSTSNLFRRREQDGKVRIDVRHFNRVLRVDPDAMAVDVEGMTTYEDLVRETLRHGLLPTVVPQLKTITIGGAVSGLGIESSSFRFGLVHETVQEMDILLGDGSIVRCSATENPDLFYGFPNSYGTLGYVLRLRAPLIPAKRYVRLVHTRFRDPRFYFDRIGELCAGANIDYLDGTAFGPGELYTTEGTFIDEAPRVSDYTYMRIYYNSIRERRKDWLTAAGYIWRWDTDWFWCSKHFLVQKPAVRLFAKWALNSRTYQRGMRLSQRLMPDSGGAESVIQDVDIPIGHAPEFLDFLFAEIGILPIWICPLKSYDRTAVFDLYTLDSNTVYINFGFWDVIRSQHEDGYFNRKIEAKAFELGGKKGLYSSSYYDPETFWTIYNKCRYDELKRKYDPGGAFLDLYAKCVRRR